MAPETCTEKTGRYPVFTVVAIRAMMPTRDNNAATSAARPGLQVEKKTVPRRPSRNVIDPSVAQR